MHLKGCLTVLNTCVDWFGYCCSKFDRMGGGGSRWEVEQVDFWYHTAPVTPEYGAA